MYFRGLKKSVTIKFRENKNNNNMTKKGRPKIYYDCIQKVRSTAEPLDLCLQHGFLTIRQHRLALRLRWLYTLNFGLPTVQAYNFSKVPGREISKYDDDTFYEKRQEYTMVTEYLYKSDRAAAKLFLNVVIHHLKPKFLDSHLKNKMIEEVEKFLFAAKTLEEAYSKKLNVLINDKKQDLYVYKN
jgi:hypothetical protein